MSERRVGGAFVAHSGAVEPGPGKIQAAAPAFALRGWLAGTLACLAITTALTAMDGGATALPAMGHALGTAVPLAVLWLLSAAGLGAWLGRRLRAGGVGTACSLGMATLLVADQWAGTLGVFAGEFPAALALLAPGWWLLSRGWIQDAEGRLPPWIAIASGVAAGAMLAAALVPAGFLWSTEFGGYDALSYHLQVPRDWLQAGSMRPLPHLAYAGFPGFVEGAFMHLMAMRSDPRQAALACQVLHASMMLAAAATVGECARPLGGARAAGLAMLAMLATPWITVTGSLAYSEAGVMLGLALAMRAAALPGGWCAGIASGLAIASMVGAKASSAALALPAALAWTLITSRHALDLRWWVSTAGVASLAMFPWLLRNAIATGAPVFPLLAGTLGAGWWSPEQAARWDGAHRNGEAWIGRLHALWTQGPAFGIGRNPHAGEPWRWLFGPLPWAGGAAIARLATDARTRRVAMALLAMLALTAGAWMALTHLQSRFLMPAIVPLAVAVGVVGARLTTKDGLARVTRLAGLGWSLLPAWALVTDAPGRLALSGRVDVASGDLDLALLESDDDEAVRAVRDGPAVEAALGTLFSGQRVLSVGWSAPFWLAPGVPIRWSTVWDTNPIEEALRQPDPGAWLAERFDLLVLDDAMLERWHRSGWLAEGIDGAALRACLDGRAMMQLAGGRRVVALRGDLRPAWPRRRATMPAVTP